MAYIFVSYAKADLDWAFWIAQELGRLGHEWEMPIDADAVEWDRFNKADNVLPVISGAYLRGTVSIWERETAQWVATGQKPNFALPVFVEDCDCPRLLAPFKRCNLFGLSEDSARATLAAYLPLLKDPVSASKFHNFRFDQCPRRNLDPPSQLSSREGNQARKPWLKNLYS
jgi:hypothetical protein